MTVEYVGRGLRFTNTQAWHHLMGYGRLVDAKNGCCMFQLDRDLPAFKKLRKWDIENSGSAEVVIANLIIPSGNLVHLGVDSGYAKCRTTDAIVHSIASKYTEGRYYNEASPTYRNTPIYRKGELVAADGFGPLGSVCDKGIHFFVDVNSAVSYF